MQAIIRRKVALAVAFLALLSSAAALSAAPQDLLQGVSWRYSLDGGKTFQAEPAVVHPGKKATFIAETRFTAAEAGQFVQLSFEHGLGEKTPVIVRLNGTEIVPPLKGVFFPVLPVPASVLKPGENVLEVEATVAVKASSTQPATAPATAKPVKIAVGAKLIPQTARDLALQSGPVMGPMDAEAFTLTCRTNMPAEVGVVDAAGKQVASSPSGFFHRVRVPRGEGKFVLRASVDGTTVSRDIAAPAWPTGDLCFVATGDSRTNPDIWGKAADAALQCRPAFVVHTGDLPADGTIDTQWDKYVFQPAQSLLAAVPFYVTIGNHEKDSPVFDKMFSLPGPENPDRNWSQEIGPVLLIGVDAARDWPADGANAQWLEKTLKESKAKFIFLALHHPAWTSGTHGKLTKEGTPSEAAVVRSREVILPLLVKYHATAMFAGHDHLYERSEPPGGVSVIITGGAGAPLYKKTETAEKQNPHSKVFASENHYCRVTVHGEECAFQAIALDGKVLDSVTWKARRP